MKNKAWVLGVCSLVIAAAAFYGGMKYSQSASVRLFQQGGAGAVGGFRSGRLGASNGAGANLVSGEILSKDATSLTVKLRDGGSKIIFLADATQIMKTAEGSRSDLAVGQQVTIMGSANADGSVSAQTIQLRPSMPAPASPAAEVPNPTAAPPAANLPQKQSVKPATVREFTVAGENFSFVPSSLTVKKGDTVKITFKNGEGFHDFTLDQFKVATRQIRSGEVESVTFTADKSGTFEYYCSVGNHRALGMKGTLVVQ